MADIKQAAKWMDEGKGVRRPPFETGIRYRASTTNESPEKLSDEGGWILICGQDYRVPSSVNALTTEDLLAEDWEIAH